MAQDDASTNEDRCGAGPTRRERWLGRLAVWVVCAAGAACVGAPARQGLQGGGDELTRARCLDEATWVDRIEGERVVLVTPDGEERDVALGSVGPGVAVGAAFFGPRPAPQCRAWIRAEIQALRGRLLARPPPPPGPRGGEGPRTTAKAAPQR